MGDTTLETIDDLLQGVIEETDDSDIHYKLQSARQLITVVQDRHEQIGETLTKEDIDEGTFDTLRELGYVE
jgi:hypothetical protein